MNTRVRVFNTFCLIKEYASIRTITFLLSHNIIVTVVCDKSVATCEVHQNLPLVHQTGQISVNVRH